MKKFLACFFGCCLVFSISGCETKKVHNNAAPSPTSNVTASTKNSQECLNVESTDSTNKHQEKQTLAELSTTKRIEKKRDVVIDTEYYTINIPGTWEEDCIYKIVDGEFYNYSIYFYEKTSYEEDGGGFLFSIELFSENEDYTYFPSYDVLGSIEVYRIGCYNVIVTYPSDVQYSDKTEKKYNEMKKSVNSVIQSISYKDECTFSKEPLPTVTVTQQEKPLIVKKFVGSWRDLSIGSRTPDGASRWDIDFRDNGTGTFYFIYNTGETIPVYFEYSPYDTNLNNLDGIQVMLENGRVLNFMASYSWSNELQTVLMSLFEVKNGSAPNLDVYWVYAMN